MKYTIDAQGKKLGRVASQAALYLRGKGSASFVPNELPDAQVEIVNAAKLHYGEERCANNISPLLRLSGGLRETQLADFVTKKGHAELLRKVILGMLPRNRQRSRIIKHLTVKN